MREGVLRRDLLWRTPSGKRVRVTLMIEEDVLRFFRSLGEGYGPRMNRVLAGFMHARLAGLLRGGETMDYLSRREEEGLDGRKPGWGEAQKDFDDLGPDVARLMSDEPGVSFESERSARLRDSAAWVKVRED